MRIVAHRHMTYDLESARIDDAERVVVLGEDEQRCAGGALRA
jgi:hypothetical protein